MIELLNRALPRSVTFSGNYASWDEALAQASGYDAVEIVDRVAHSTRRVIAGDAVYERDSVLFDKVNYSWPLLASLLQVGLECGSLRVIDFGGSLGSTWRQNRQFFERLTIPLQWHVVEQDKFVEFGRNEFSNGSLTFAYTMAEASTEGIDVVLLSGSLCYVADPESVLRDVLATSAKYLIIDRLPLTAGREDRIAVQQVTEPIYTASYPVRIFGEDRLIVDLLKPWRLIERWECELQPDLGSRSHGFFLVKQ